MSTTKPQQEPQSDRGSTFAGGELPAGTVIAVGYRVVRAIAAGGMGTVYEVEQMATGARRALKVLHGEFARDERLRARFIQEARVGVTIKSDHVAQVLDAGIDDRVGVLFIVMELLHGTTLSREIKRRGCFTWQEVHEILRQISHAVGAAHEIGVVHRDLKPANVFLSNSRTAGVSFTVKVLDFGIAKVLAEAGEGVTAIIGTPAWMAPEQTDAEALVGPPADVWSIGLIAFLSLVGRHYWPSANHRGTPTAAVMRDLVLEEIVLPSIRAASYEAADRLPPGFDEWFARCVVRDPLARFPNATEAFAAFSSMMAPHIDSGSMASAPSLARPLGQSTPPFAGVQVSRDLATLAEGASSRSRSRLRSQPSRTVAAESVSSTPQARPKNGYLRFAAPAAVVASLAITLFVVLRDRADPAEVAALPSASHSPTSSIGVAVPPRAKVIVRVHGSNTIGAELAPALAEAFLKRRNGASTLARRANASDELLVEASGENAPTEAIEIHAHGSATAFADLGSGACDLGMSSRRVHDSEAGLLAKLGNMRSAGSEHVIALDGIAVIVNPANAVSKLTKVQLQKGLRRRDHVVERSGRRRCEDRRARAR